MKIYCRKVIFLSTILIMGSFITSCAIVYNVPTEPVVFPATNQINMKVALRLDEKLCSARWEKDIMGDHHILPIGSALCKNAEVLTRALFSEVRIIKDEAAPLPTDVHAVLIPSLVAIERNYSKIQTTSILFAWTLNNRSGDPIWVTTVAGEGKGPIGQPLFSRDAGQEQIKMVLDDIFKKSFHEMSGSQLIREFAAKQRQ